MYFRIGSIAIPYLIDLLLQLEDEGKLSLDDKLAKYRPNFPDADEVTLRMPATATSGYPGFIQENPAFQQVLLENSFRQFTANELIHWAFHAADGLQAGDLLPLRAHQLRDPQPGISQVTGKSVSALMHERVLAPFGPPGRSGPGR